MRFLTNIPIGRKVTWVILLASTAALFVATLALFIFQLATLRKSFIRDLGALSEIIANQSRAAVHFQYTNAVNDIFATLTNKPDIVSALILLPGGTRFASYGRAPTAESLKSAPTNGYWLEGEFLCNARPIIAADEHRATLYMQSEYDRPFHQLVRAHLSVLAAVFGGSILLTVALSSRLQRVISDPILGLAATAKSIAEEQDYSARAAKVGEDEVGNLTDAFNQMLAQIQRQDSDLHKAQGELEGRVKALQHEIAERQRAEQELDAAHHKLLDASRQAGMAEVATGVLHNVGNVLNSVNVSTTLLRDQVRKSEVASVVKLAELLRQHENDVAAFLTRDPKGCMIPQFLATLAQHLAAERESMVSELELLAKNVEHIKDIVSMQQSYASVAGFIERVNVEDMVEDALQFNAAALTRHGVEVIRQYDPVPLLMADKHKILQILVNLIANAKYALQESGRADKRLTVRIGLKSDRSVQIVVQDNGVGIPTENLTRIFAHGFTTRTKGHGFGLHSSALAAQEMGGELNAQSGGQEQGATFVLELPLPVKESS